MATLSNLAIKCFSNNVFVKSASSLEVSCRYASKKSSGACRNAGNSKPKHRGWKKQDGSIILSGGTILATQNRTRWHPGLNVGFGRNGNLFAMVPGKVVITCEKIDANWDHSWIKQCYPDRQNQVIHKKHFNIIPEPQHNIFKLIDKI